MSGGGEEASAPGVRSARAGGRVRGRPGPASAPRERSLLEETVEIRRCIDRVLRRVSRRDDYGHLLARGDVIQRLDDVDDPEAWRAEIRRQARSVRIKVRTGVTDGIVWALLAAAWTAAREAESER